MRILKIFDGDYPWDVRVEKSLRTLVEAGHEVTLLARNRQGRPERELAEGVTILRLPPTPRLEPLLGFPAFFHPRWARAVRRAADAAQPERIVVRDLPLAPLALRLGARRSIPVIVDMAEPYPEALRSNWKFDRLGGIDHLIRNPRLADAVERWVVRRAPRTLVVSTESGERLERLGLPADRWTLVGNTPELERVRSRAVEAGAIPASLRDRELLLFTGILVGDRGLDIALRSLPHLEGPAADRAILVVIGDGPARRGFEEEARALGVSDRVRFLGWIPHDELPPFWAAARVGLLPFRRCTHIDTTLANKLFDYMALGLPMVASDAPPMVRVLSETGAGLTFENESPEALARCVSVILRDRAVADRMSQAGRKAALETYNWKLDGARLLEAVERP